MFILWLAILWPAYECHRLLEMADISKCEYRAVSKFLTLKKQPANSINEHFVSVYGDSSPLYATVPRRVV